MSMIRRVMAAFAITLLAMAVLAGHPAQAAVMRAEGSSSSSPCGAGTTPPSTYQHVIWIWMEDNALAKVIGNAAAPYITESRKAVRLRQGLARQRHRRRIQLRPGRRRSQLQLRDDPCDGANR